MILSNFTCVDVRYSSIISNSTSNTEGKAEFAFKILAGWTEFEHNAEAYLSVAVLNIATLALTEAQGVLISISMRHMFLLDKAVSHHCSYLNFGNKWKGFCVIVKNQRNLYPLCTGYS